MVIVPSLPAFHPRLGEGVIPGDLDKRFAALTRELASLLLELAGIAVATILAEFPDLVLGPLSMAELAQELGDLEDLTGEPEGWED
jgi:hypothetical protein